MPLNDDTEDEFATHLENEHVFDANPPPGIEMLGVNIQPDRGSGSFAEDGRLEVAEDQMDSDVMGHGPASMDGQSEIGDWSPEDQIGDWSPEDQIGNAAENGQSEIGREVIQAPFESFMMGPTGMGESPRGMDAEAERRAEADGVVGDWSPEDQGRPTHLGDWSPEDQGRMVGSAAMYGPTEIGNAAEAGQSEIGGPASEDGQSEIGAAAAMAKVVEKARDNRQPAPPMKVVNVDAPVDDEGYDADMAEFLIGAAEATGMNLFPITTEFMKRCGAGMPPRYVRVDTEESYKAFRTEQSPEMSDLAVKVNDLQAKLDAHLADPHAHEESPELSDDIEDLVMLGEEAQAAEAEKRVELWMQKHYDGLVEAWREGDMVCASLKFPGKQGEVRICTAMEPIAKCVEEMSRHAAESGVPAATVVGVLPAMGCVLGAGTIMKEVSAAARPLVETAAQAGNAPFVVRIEPKTNPALCALAMLMMACLHGNKQACAELAMLGETAPAPIRQAMMEALVLAKAASK